MTIEKIMLNLLDIGEKYRNTDDEKIRIQYEDYVRTVIDNEVEPRDRNSVYSYWEGLKLGK